MENETPPPPETPATRDRIKIELLQRIDAQLAEAIDAAKGAGVEQQRALLKHFEKIETGLGSVLECLNALDKQLDQQAEAAKNPRSDS